MKYLLFIIFVVVPIAEIAMFIQVGDILGLWPTIGVVILTAFLGTGLLRYQGMAALAKAQGSLSTGELPLEPVLHGVFLVIAGLLLLTPGFLTDFVGFLLFVPPVRLAIGRWILQKFKNSKNIHMHHSGPTSAGRKPTSPSGSPIIEGEFTIAKEDNDATGSPEKPSKNSSSGDSPWKQ